MSRSPLTKAAGEYLALGLRVLALTGKTPNVKLHKTGLYSALSGEPETQEDWEFIESFMDHAATTGVGICTGEPYVVVDIDGPVGADEWATIMGRLDPLSDARWVAMTRHGLHMWFAPPMSALRREGEGFVGPGTMKLGTKLDLKGYGGYVAAPPSAFDDPDDCERFHQPTDVYRWLSTPGVEAPREAPEPLARRITKHVYNQASAIESKAAMKRRWGPKWESGATVFYAQAGFDPLLDGMRTAEDGNRNNYLHWAASTLAEEGAADEFFEELAAIAKEFGLNSVEVKRTIRSARHAHG